MKFRFAVLLFLLTLVRILPVMADDIAIYGTQSVTIEPNVLIIFDTSGSMAEEVKKAAYNSKTTYAGSYAKESVYYFSSNSSYVYTGTLATEYRNTLNTVGYVQARVKINNRNRWLWLYSGNYLNYYYLVLPSDGRTKLDVAKEAVKDLLAKTTGVRFGLMAFNSCDGGRIVAACGTPAATISTNVVSVEPLS
jgi:type IV pilus assembly protein PilY1